MAQDDGSKPKVGEKRERMDLGWAGVVYQPGKRQEIEGVTASSIMDLQAQLYQAQESVRQRKDAGAEPQRSERRARGGLDLKGMMSGKNPGIEERNARDMSQHKSTDVNERISQAYAALERKAALYEKLTQGQLCDDDEKYEVDFLVKGAGSSGQQGPGHTHAQSEERQHAHRDSWGGAGGSSGHPPDHRHHPPAPHNRGSQHWPVSDGRHGPPGRGSDSGDEEDRDRGREAQRHQLTVEEEAEAQRRKQHKEVVMQLAQQTRQQREKAAELKRQREQQAQSKVDKLKEEFLKKQLLKAKSKTAGKPGA